MSDKARAASEEIDALLATRLPPDVYIRFTPANQEVAAIISRHFPPTEATQVAVEATVNQGEFEELKEILEDVNPVFRQRVLAALRVAKKEGDDGPTV